MARLSRALAVLKFWPREALRRWPEQTVAGSIMVSIGTVVFIYKVSTNDILGFRPYYRGRYDVVRPEAEIVGLWRVPEDYPAPYETNRLADDHKTYKKDYGYKLSL